MRWVPSSLIDTGSLRFSFCVQSRSNTPFIGLRDDQRPGPATPSADGRRTQRQPTSGSNVVGLKSMVVWVQLQLAGSVAVESRALLCHAETPRVHVRVDNTVDNRAPRITVDKANSHLPPTASPPNLSSPPMSAVIQTKPKPSSLPQPCTTDSNGSSNDDKSDNGGSIPTIK